MTTKISQKDYLKKYLSNDKSADKKKKKKKSKTISGQSVKIIDDDIDLSKLHQIADEDLEVYGIGEDAPTIVGVVDDRPPELIAKEDYKNNGKWKVIADDDGFTSSLNVQHTDRDGKVSRTTGNDSTRTAKKYEVNDDLSPPRVKRRKNDDRSYDAESRRMQESKKRSDKPRTSRFTDASSPPPRRRKSRSGSDNSPPRKHLSSSSKTPSNLSQRKIKQEPDSDASPPRRNDVSKNRRHSDSDQSPPRIKSRSVASPPRRKVKQEPDSDESPPRRRNRLEQSDSDQSPPRKNKIKQERDASAARRRSRSPRRRQSRSPYRRDHSGRYDNRSASNRDRRSSRSPLNRRRSLQRDTSPKSHRRRDRRDSSNEHTNTKMMKTLDGKSAGLQDAKTLRVENDIFKKREEEMFNKMSADVLGKNAEAVVRDRRTGRIRDLGEEAAKEHEKLVKEQERKNLYDKWGKGLKQVEDYRSRLEGDLHEINKPLARYSDDKDLEDLLKQQERDGDPMLNYIRNKKESATDGTPRKPIYRGAYPENRFGIRPGYRWDGVNRSNGYETKWFDVQSQRKAGEEEAYKYSTEDM